MRTKTLLLSAALAVGLTMAGGAGAQTTLSIATGGTGGVYYPLGGGLGNILGKELPGTTATCSSSNNFWQKVSSSMPEARMLGKV